MKALSKRDRDRLLREVELYGKRFQGRKEYIRFLKGEYITPKEKALANCFVCMGYYQDGAASCGNPACPMYSYMPYRHLQNHEAKETGETSTAETLPSRSAQTGGEEL